MSDATPPCVPNNWIEHHIKYAGHSISFVLPSAEDHISKIVMTTGTFYEEEMLQSIAGALNPGDMVVDVGANIGNHTLFFSKVLGCRVMALEPVESTAAILQENVRINGASSLVEIKKIAAGEKEGSASIVSFDPKNIGSATLKASRQGKIQVSPLDILATFRPVRLLKIDVEGMELSVLKGAVDILVKDRPLVLCEAATDEAYQKVADFMGGHGYSPVAVYNATETFLFLPARSDDERAGLITRSFEQMMALQRESRRLNDRLKQAGRYSERMRSEAVSLMQARLSEEAAEHAARKDEWDAQMADARLELVASERQHVHFERRLALKDEEICDLKNLLETERIRFSRQLAEMESSSAQRRREGQTLHATLIEYQKISERLESEMEELRNERNQLRNERDQLRAKLHAANDAAREQLAQAGKKMQATRAEAEASVRRRINAEGMQARAERELERVNRHLNNRRSAAFADKQEVERLKRTFGEQSFEISRLRESLSHRLGVLIISSLKSPLRMLAMVWTIPKLLLDERRRSPVRNGDG